MASLGTFNAFEHSTEQSEYTLLPDGIYKLEVTASEVKEDGPVTTLSVTYGVTAPEEFKGQRFMSWMDIKNPDAEKLGRGQRDLAKLVRAVGASTSPQDSEEFHFIEFTAKVKKGEAGVSKAGNAYKARNSISRFYFPDEESVPEPGLLDAPPASKAAPTRAPANDSRPAASNDNAAAPAKKATPWGKK